MKYDKILWYDMLWYYDDINMENMQVFHFTVGLLVNVSLYITNKLSIESQKGICHYSTKKFLRTRTALSLYKVYGDSTLLLLNGTL